MCSINRTITIRNMQYTAHACLASCMGPLTATMLHKESLHVSQIQQKIKFAVYCVPVPTLFYELYTICLELYINCMLFVSNKLLEIFPHPLLYRQCWWEHNYNISGQENGKYLIYYRSSLRGKVPRSRVFP